MPKFRNLLAEKAKAEIQIGGSTVTVVFNVMWREQFSDEEWTALLGLKGRDYLKMLLPRALQSWDITDDDEHAIPCTAEAFDQFALPDRLLIAVENAVTGSDLSGKAISRPSSGT